MSTNYLPNEESEAKSLIAPSAGIGIAVRMRAAAATIAAAEAIRGDDDR